jgi:hypothetical protein
LAFGVEIDKDIVRRVLSVHYRPESDSGCPSWLTFLGHTKDSLWSCDLFRCESATLRSHWVLVVMDQFTRRIIGFGVHRGIVDGLALCRMFHRAIRGHSLPKYLSSDHDPLYRYHQWEANLRILDVTEIKTVPYVPLSHPFVERLIGTIRRGYLDRILFWTAADLEAKLIDFQHYYNGHRTHAGLEGRLPGTACGRNFTNWSWFVPVAEALPRLVPNSDSRLILLIRHARVWSNGEVLCHSDSGTTHKVGYSSTDATTDGAENAGTRIRERHAVTIAHRSAGSCFRCKKSGLATELALRPDFWS